MQRGASRRQTAIKGLGIRAVVAASFARTFYRNAINDGLTIVECPEVVAAVSEGDNLSIDLVKGLVTLTASAAIRSRRFHPPVRKILAARWIG